MRGFEAIPELLRRGDQSVVFSMLGGTNVPWIARGVLDGSLRLVKTRHEQTAVGAAGAFARATGTIGLASVTRGPGFANAVNALVVATHSHVPIVLIVGESPTPLHRGAQNLDQRGLTSAIGAGFHHAEQPEDLESAYWSAYNAAAWNGLPQVLSVRSALLRAEVPLSEHRFPTERPHADRRAINAAVDALAAADRPLVLAGTGVLLSDCISDVDEFADLIGAARATSLRANQLFAGHPSDLGLSGDWSPLPIRRQLARADVVVAIGASLNDYTTAGGQAFPDATVIQVDVAPSLAGHAVAPDLTVVSDARFATRALVEEWRRRGLETRSPWVKAPDRDEIRAAVRSVDLGHDPRRGLDPREVFIAFDDVLPSERVVVTDTGRFLGTLPSVVASRDARSWLVGNSFQSVGQGMGAAIGAATAFPDRPVVLFTGDGGFTMSAQDIDSVAMNDLSVTVVIINDEQYGSEMHHLDHFELPFDIIRQPIPDVSMLARAFGGSGLVVTELEQIRALELPPRGLLVVDVRVDPAVNVRDVPRAWSEAMDPTAATAHTAL